MLLYNIDQMRSQMSEDSVRQKQSMPEVESFVRQGVNNFMAWQKEASASPLIQKLKDTFEQLRQAELAKHIKSLTPSEQKSVDEVTKSLLQRILKYPAMGVKEACLRGESEKMAQVLQALFDLERTESPKPVDK